MWFDFIVRLHSGMFPAGYWLLLGNKYVELIDQYDAAVNVWLGFQEWDRSSWIHLCHCGTDENKF